ncbi:hypothetical protein FR932_06205 [Moritella marina ATCC 15381]|uniref:Lipoprotein n=1 Tax=Moritella marina ATCC 15381 TaxID=1202962 RepID=A0A5J6WH85_MORMI|nr:hypothetical protein [Moritella marina]QFI37453.1 hypothetical protein FR932_06205 [Moritella marina ATCC 15381]
MRKFIVILVFVLSGCVMSSAPENNADFSDKTKLESFVGCYANVGESGFEGPQRLLSEAIWPKSTIEHNKIEFVEVDLASETSVLVAAKSKLNESVYKSKFVEGQDFEIKNGQVTLNSEFSGSLAGESGNPFIGVAGGSIMIGLDENGHGKMSESATFVGTAFIFIPVAGHSTDSIRFLKLPSGCH